MSGKTDLTRVAFSPGEFAALFGKQQTWGYRQIYAGKVNAITEHGRILIPAAEVDRILGTAGRYNGLTPKVKKRANKLDAWRKFIEERRKSKSPSGVKADTHLANLRPSTGKAREAALARLGSRKAPRPER